MQGPSQDVEFDEFARCKTCNANVDCFKKLLYTSIVFNIYIYIYKNPDGGSR